MGVKRLTREQIINRIIGFDFVEWYERLLDIKAVIDLPKPKNGVYHRGQRVSDNVPEEPEFRRKYRHRFGPAKTSIFETGTAGFAPSSGDFGDTNEWNRRAREKKLGKE